MLRIALSHTQFSGVKACLLCMLFMMRVTKDPITAHYSSREKKFLIICLLDMGRNIHFIYFKDLLFYFFSRIMLY